METPLYFMLSNFEIGKSLEFIESIQDPTIKDLSLAEYHYFRGNHKDALKITEPYLNSSIPMIRLYAYLVYSLSSVTQKKISFDMQNLQNLLSLIPQEQKKIASLFLETTPRILFHLPMEEKLISNDSLKDLPQNLKAFCSYLMSHEAFLEGEYNKSLGIIETSLVLNQSQSPIVLIYLHLEAAADSMYLKRVPEAQKHFKKAWDLAYPDKFFQPFGEYQGMVSGLIETNVRTLYPTEYKRILEITYNFAHGWMNTHDKQGKKDAMDLLNGVEFTIASLANQGWSNTEIADYLHISTRTVKYYISSIFTKFNISSRKEIENFLPDEVQSKIKK